MFKLLPKSFLFAAAMTTLASMHQVSAQKDVNQTADTYSLEDCIRIALETNPQVKISELQVHTSDNLFQQSKWQRWPSLGFNASQGFSSGRNIDPYTNLYVQQNVSSSNFQLNSSVVLFNGFQLQNAVKRNGYNLQATQKDLAGAKNDLMLNVALSYLQIISSKELIEVAQRQVDASSLQVERTAKLVEAGTQAESTLLDLRAQLANDEVTLVNAQNNLSIAELNLKQLMNMPGSNPVNIVMIDVKDPTLQAYDATVQEVYETALSTLPQMQAANFRIESAKRSIEMAKAAGIPSLSLNAGLFTTYSSVAPKQRFVADGTGSTTVEQESATSYVKYNDIVAPVINKVVIPNGSIKEFGYFSQLDGNRNANISLNLRIPIFSNFQVKYNVANARIQQKTVEYQGQQVALSIRKNVEQAYIDMTNAAKRYSATANQVRALAEAFRVSQSKFDVGAINSVDYNIAKANLDRANANLVQTKYDYVFRTKVLDFYMNRPLSDF